MIFNQEDWDKWAQERVNALEDDMVSSYAVDTFERDKELIQSFYDDILENFGRIPNLIEIKDEVDMFNSEITWEIAELEYQSQGGSMNVSDDEKNDHIGELHDELERYYSDYQYSKLEEYLEDILDELDLPFTYEEDNQEYDEILSDSEIVINDCQSFIFLEFLPVPQYSNPGLDFLIVERMKDVNSDRQRTF